MQLKKGLLLSIFLVGLIINYFAVGYLEAQEVIYDKDRIKLLEALFGLYSAHLGIIISALFLRKNTVKSTSDFTFYIALVLAIIWNFLICNETINACRLKNIPYTELIGHWTLTSAIASFLVTGMISYYFNEHAK